MPPVIWSPRALFGVQRAYRFLAEKYQATANAMAMLLFKHAEILEKFSSSGRPATDLDPEHRELIIPFGASGYVLLYHFDKDRAAVTVLAVRHQREVGY